MSKRPVIERYLIDTNIIIYSFDKSNPKKRELALNIIGEALSSGKGIISHQVIQEFISVSQSKFKSPLNMAEITHYLEEVLFVLWKSFPDRESCLTALQIQQNYKISWWDASIVAAAKVSGCSRLISEDLQHNLMIEGVKVVNPFLESP